MPSKLYQLTLLSSMVFLLIIISNVSAHGIDSIKRCMSINEISCKKCVFVEVDIITGNEIITGKRSPDKFVGDYFTYNITLINMNETINSTTFTVNISNPIRESIKYRSFSPITLEINDSHILYPIYRNNPKEYDVIFFDIEGSYKIELSADTYIEYFRFYKDTCVYTISPGSFKFYFDVMPKWERDWKEEMRSQQIANQKIMNETYNVIKEMRNISQEMERSSNKMESLTHVIIFLTAINFGFVYYSSIEKKKLKSLLIIIVVLIFAYLLYWSII